MSRQSLMYQHNSPGQSMQILQSRAGLIALLQRIPLGELSCAHQSCHVVLVITSIVVMTELCIICCSMPCYPAVRAAI